MEDLLDTWPGTLLVVSHDRYLLERVTDQQYAVLDGRLRHLPGGVDEYLRLADGSALQTSESNPMAASSGSQGSSLSGAESRAMQKEVGSIERKLSKLRETVADREQELADHDQTDFEGLGEITARMNAAKDEIDELEMRWLELSEQLEG
ncbi:ABC transporter ATP-binding protein [Kocuria palustris]